MIKAIVVDDEPKSRKTIVDLLARYCPSIEMLGEAGGGEEAYALASEKKPGLVFLDIEMPYENGFEWLQRFRQIPFEVIFITAYDQYALQAIRTCALDYLLKPVNIQELKSAVEKAETRIRDRNPSGLYELLLQNLKVKQPGLGKLAIPTRDGFEFLEIGNIVTLEADGGYTTIHLLGKRKTVSTRNLKEYEEILPDSLFFRAHHSHIVNLQHIKNYHKGEGGYVVMCDDSTVDISKRRKKDFLDLFNQ